MLEESLQRLSSLVPIEWGRRLGWVVLVSASLLLLVAIGKLPFIWLDDYKLAHQTVMVSPNDLQIDHEVREGMLQIPNQHLFGNADISLGHVPITSLQLSLVGIMHAAPQSQSRVIISEAGQPGKLYRINDTLPMGVIVNAIEHDGVILENAGHFEKLPLQRHELAFQGEPKQLLQEG